MGGDEEREGTSLSEEADLVDGCDDGINLSKIVSPAQTLARAAIPHSLALEWSPNNRTVSNCKLGESAAWENATL